MPYLNSIKYIILCFLLLKILEISSDRNSGDLRKSSVHRKMNCKIYDCDKNL